MSGSARRFAVLGLVGLALLGSEAYGPRFARPRQPAVNINPNRMIARGLNLQHYAFNSRQLTGAYGTPPPFRLGYNPFIKGASTIVTPDGRRRYPYPPYPSPRYPTIVVLNSGPSPYI